ncbi:MAG: hypothetical protein H0V41_14135 [Pseudonocardiales bacterium]|nr:hypothetical protein [Pseudonocardiales bacterium]
MPPAHCCTTAEPSRPVYVLAVLAGQPSWARSQARACGTDGRGGRPAGFPWKGNTESAWDRLLRVAKIRDLPFFVGPFHRFDG